MAVTHTDTDISKVTFNRFSSESDYQAAVTAGQVSATDINLIDGNGSLAGLDDTTISSPTNGQVLTYNSTSGKWVNSAASGGGGTEYITINASQNGSTNPPITSGIYTYMNLTLTSASHTPQQAWALVSSGKDVKVKLIINYETYILSLDKTYNYNASSPTTMYFCVSQQMWGDYNIFSLYGSSTSSTWQLGPWQKIAVLDGAEFCIYEDLKQKVSNNQLVPGKKYLFYEFYTVTNSFNLGFEYTSARNGFGIMLTAKSDHEFFAEAEACSLYYNDGSIREDNWYWDQYHAELNKWKIWYDFEGGFPYRWSNNTINNTHIRAKQYDDQNYAHPYAWKDPINGGFVYTDTRFPTTEDSYYTAKDDSASGYTITNVGEHYGDIYRMIDEHGNEAPYDFKSIQFKRYTPATGSEPKGFTTDDYCLDNSIVSDMNSSISMSQNYEWMYTFSVKVWENDYYAYKDASLYSNVCLDTPSGIPKQRNLIHDNIIKPYITVENGATIRPDIQYQDLNNIVFLNDNENVESTTAGTWYERSFNCYNNEFDYNCRNMTFGRSCNSNKFGKFCNGILIGELSFNNEFGFQCSFNDIGKNFAHNKIGIQFRKAILGNYIQYNVIGNQCSFFTFEGNNIYLEIHDNCQEISLCQYLRYSIFEQRNKYIDLYSNDSLVSSSNIPMNLKITQASSIDSNSGWSWNADGLTNRAYQTVFMKDINGNIMEVLPVNAANNSY